MMSNPQEAGENAPPPNTVPLLFQLNFQPGQQNVYPSPPMRTVSPGAPQMVHAAEQPLLSGFQVPAGVIPQATGLSESLQIFLKGKPKSLGIVLIVMAILQIICNIVLLFATYYYYGSLYVITQFFGPVFYIIAGSLSIAAQKNLNLYRIKGSFAFNILSSIFSFIGVLINIANLFYGATLVGYIVISLLLLVNLLVFSVSISLAVFGFRAIENVPLNNITVLVLQNGYGPLPPFPTNSPKAQEAFPPPYVSQSDEKHGPY